MSIDKMREHEWSIDWSGGKDSTATIIACIKYDVPIKEINYIRMMYDEEIPATLPIMTEFVDKCIVLFRKRYGLKVNVIKSETCVNGVCNKVYKRSKNKELNGTRYTLASLCHGKCSFTSVKKRASKLIRHSEYELIGYAIDEPRRYCRLKHPNQESILCTLNITENKAYDICKRNNLLSPLYGLGIKRDGCWFCPNCNKRQIEYVMNEYPNLAEIIYDEFSCRDGKYLFADTNTWIKQYLSDWG